jgi:predicted metal-dependent phosphoesterase TrpH
VLIDLHCHTARFSACSSLEPEALVRAADAAGVDAICLTEHDRLWPEEEVHALAKLTGIAVLRGMEVTTEAGHVLVYGLSALPPGSFLVGTLVAAVRAAGGIAVLAHPARAGQPRLSRSRIGELFDCVETLNGSDGDAENHAASAFDILTPLPGIAGSDCHSPAEIGRVATRLPAAVRDERELVAVLRQGRHRVERLPARSQANHSAAQSEGDDASTR